MRFPQEVSARDFHRDLLERIASSPAIRVEIAGAGVHWHCSATKGERSCMVHFLDDRGPEYLAYFRGIHDAESIGRSRSSREAMEAVVSWLVGWHIAEIYPIFPFVDREKRGLAAIESEILDRQPDLARLATVELVQAPSGHHELTVKTPDRSCRVSYYGREEYPDALFEWEECPMFRTRTGDFSRLSGMLRRWLGDRAMPSTMAREFPELEIEPVATYYEQGRPVEGEFLVSWDLIEQFYGEYDHFPHRDQILALIAEIRRAGYDRTLRAGQSLWTLIVSRSRRHGLREDQPFVGFDFRENSMDVSIRQAGRFEERFSLLRIGLEARVEDALNRLVAGPID